MHILKFLLRFCGYHIRLVDKKNHYPRNSPLNWCRICLAGLQPPHASQVVTPSAWWSSPWLASPMWWVISVAALHSGPASAKFFSDDGTGGRKLPAGPGLPLLFVPWFSLLDWTKIWVTHFLLGVLSTLIECSSNVGWVSDFLGTFSTTGIPQRWSNLVGAVFVGMVWTNTVWWKMKVGVRCTVFYGFFNMCLQKLWREWYDNF